MKMSLASDIFIAVYVERLAALAKSASAFPRALRNLRISALNAVPSSAPSVSFRLPFVSTVRVPPRKIFPKNNLTEFFRSQIRGRCGLSATGWQLGKRSPPAPESRQTMGAP